MTVTTERETYLTRQAFVIPCLLFMASNGKYFLEVTRIQVNSVDKLILPVQDDWENQCEKPSVFFV